MKKCQRIECGHTNQPGALVCEACFAPMGPTRMRLVSMSTGKFREYAAGHAFENFILGKPFFSFIEDPEKDLVSFQQFRLTCLVDGGTTRWAVSHISTAHQPTLLNEVPLSDTLVDLANGHVISVGGKAKLTVDIQ